LLAGIVKFKGGCSDSGVFIATNVRCERGNTDRRVESTISIEQERLRANCRVAFGNAVVRDVAVGIVVLKRRWTQTGNS
jgi:hypothetical protein